MPSVIQYLKSARALFPKWLYLIALLPFLVTLYYTPDLIDWRQLLIVFAWISLFTTSYILTGKKLFYWIPLVFFSITSFVELFNLFLLKSPINIVSLLTLFNTHFSEAQEYLETKGFYRLLFVLPFLTIVYLAAKYELNRAAVPRILTYLILGFAVVFLGENLIKNRLLRKGSPFLVKTGVGFLETVNTLSEMKGKNKSRLVEVQEEKPELDKTIVLILGESTSRRHMQLYGYKRENNPRLSSRNDIAVYKDVIAGFSNTISSVTRSLSNLNITHPDTLPADLDILDLMNSAGYETYWISNQPPIGIWENWITLLAKKSKHTIFTNTHSNSSREANYIKSYDEKLFEPFESVLSDSAKDRFIVLHMMGNHTSYRKRYPKNFEKWTGSNEYDATQAQYDNSILYTDYVVDHLLTSLEKSKGVSAAIFTSDHGENVYDEFDNCGHDYGAVLPKSNMEIPFVFWLSENYNNAFPEKTKRITKRTHLPYKTDDLFHTLADLSGVFTPLIDSTRSVFHEAYDSTRPRILETGDNYDTYSY